MMLIKKISISILVFLWVFILSGCSPLSSLGQLENSDQSFFSDRNQIIGQTFTSRQNGLIGIRLFVKSTENEVIQAALRVYDSPLKNRKIIEVEKDVSTTENGEYLEFIFPYPLNSYLQDYYFEISIQSNGKVYFGGSDLFSYEDGSLYINSQPVDAQLSFIPLHDPFYLMIGLVRQGFDWVLWLLAAIYLFALPGYAILRLLIKQKWEGNWQLKLSISLALGVSIYPILLLLEDLPGLKIGALNAYIPGALSSIYFMGKWWKSGKKINLDFIKHLSLITIASLWVLFSIIFTRFWAIRALSLPMWGDSVHHTLISQLIIENGGLFNSWQPYAEMESLTYHFGFHANVAVISWLTGAVASQATLMGGQLMNIFAIIVLFPLAWKASQRKKIGGVVAWFVAGLLSFMPMFYVNWGRYTQLTGQVLLPVIVFLLWEVIEDGHWNWRISIILGFLSASLAVTHYRVFIFLLAAIPPLLLYYKRENIQPLIMNLSLTGLVGFLLFLPWGVRLIGGKLSQNLITQVSTPPNALGDFAGEYNQIGVLTSYLPAWLWLLLAVSILIGMWMREKGFVYILGWWLIVLLLANPAWVNLPGSGVLSNFAVFIAIYIPTSVLLGATFSRVIFATGTQLSNKVVKILFLIGFLLLTFPYVRDRIRDVHPPQYAMATRSDIRAAKWISENLPAESKILVNSFFAYGGSVIVGSDGGWWMPALTGRKINVPPMPYTTEQGPFVDYAQYINHLRWLIEEKGYTSSEVIDELKKRGIEFAYIGQKRGSVNYAGSIIMKPEEMIESGFYEPIYHQDAVWVFRIFENYTN